MILKLKTEQYVEEVEKYDGPIILTFGFPGCAPCRSLEGHLNKLAETTNVKIVKFDIEESADIAVQYEVTMVPTTFFINHGKKHGRLNGVAGPLKLKRYLDETIAVPVAVQA